MNSTGPKGLNERQTFQPSLRRTFQLMFAALFVLVLAQLALSVWSSGLKQALTTSQQRRYESYLIANELRLSADDRTRMAQSFAVSGDPKFELYYNQIIAIRDGLRPRPEDYDKVYWELVVALGRQPRTNGDSMSFDQRLLAAGGTEAELAKLGEAKHQSDSLGLLEQVAMNAVKGSYRDAGGQFNLRGAPNRGYALQLLHGPEYQQSKARIMKSIREVQVMVDRRTRTEGQRLSAQAASLARVETWLLIVTAILVALVFIILNRQLITPILELTASAASVGRNGFFRRVLISRNDELGTLAGALNRMSETVEQKIAESAANEERFRGWIEALPDALLLTDAGGKIKLVNRQTESLLGYGRSELLGQQLAALLPGATGGDASSTSATNRELAARRKDGETVPVEMSFNPITVPDGSELSCGVLRDLTARKSAAAEIERHLHFQTALLDAIPHPMFIQDFQARFVTCNQAYEAAFGVSRDFLKGKTVLDLEFILDDVRLRFHAEEEEVIRTTARRSYELPIRYHDQTERVTRYTVSGFQLTDGSPGGLIGLLVDITDHKQSEAELGRSQRLTQAVMDNANAFIYVKDTQGRYLFVNRNYETLLGRPATELLGRSAADLFGRKAGAAHEEGDREVRQSRERREREEASEINGVTRHFISRMFPLVNEAGELFGTAGVSIEITELKHLQQELAGAKEAADTASKAGSAGVEPMGFSKTEFEPRDLDAVMASLQSQPAPAQPPSPDTEFDAREFTGKRVLLVADNEANQFIAEELLARAGITLTIAKHGHEAVAMVAAGDYDAVLMDLQLPEMDGLEATSVIRKSPASRSLPIIALTANATQSDLEACRDAGMDDYVAKPIDRKLLFRVLRKWLLQDRASAAPVAEIAIAEVAFATAEMIPAGAMTVSDVVANEVSPESPTEPIEPLPAGNADLAIDHSAEPSPASVGSETGAPAEVAEPKPEGKKRIRKPREVAAVATAIAPVSAVVTTGETPTPVEAPAVNETSSNASASQLWAGAGDELEPAAPVRDAVVPVDEVVEAPPTIVESEPGPPWEVTVPVEPAAARATKVEPVTTPPTEGKPEKQKRSRKKKESDGTQPDLFGDYDTTKDEAGPVEVTVEADGVPLVPGLDLREAMSRLGLPLETIREQADRFGGGLGRICQDLRAALAARDNDSARRHAHSLAGAAGSLSADTLRRLAKTLELALKFEQGDTQAMVAELEHEAARVAEGIRQLTALPEASLLNPTEPADADEPLDPAPPTAPRPIQAALEELAVALDGGDFDAISQRAEKLKSIDLPTALAADYECLTEMVDNFDHAEAAALVRSMQQRVA